MMRALSRLGVLFVVFVASASLLAACSPDLVEVEVEPERAETCDDLIPTGTALAVQLLAAIEAVPIDVLIGEAPAEGPFGELLAIGVEFDAKSASLGCDPEELNASIMEQVGDDVEPGSLAAVLLLQIMQGGSAESAATTTRPPVP